MIFARFMESCFEKRHYLFVHISKVKIPDKQEFMLQALSRSIARNWFEQNTKYEHNFAVFQTTEADTHFFGRNVHVLLYQSRLFVSRQKRFN